VRVAIFARIESAKFAASVAADISAVGSASFAVSAAFSEFRAIAMAANAATGSVVVFTDAGVVVFGDPVLLTGVVFIAGFGVVAAVEFAFCFSHVSILPAVSLSATLHAPKALSHPFLSAIIVFESCVTVLQLVSISFFESASFVLFTFVQICAAVRFAFVISSVYVILKLSHAALHFEMVVFCSVESPLSQADTIEAVQFDRVFATAMTSASCFASFPPQVRFLRFPPPASSISFRGTSKSPFFCAFLDNWTDFVKALDACW